MKKPCTYILPYVIHEMMLITLTYLSIDRRLLRFACFKYGFPQLFQMDCEEGMFDG